MMGQSQYLAGLGAARYFGNGGLCALCHESLRRSRNHSVVGDQQVPAWLGFPCRLGDRAGQRVHSRVKGASDLSARSPQIVANCRGTALDPKGYTQRLRNFCALSDHVDRIGQYRHLAARLRGLAEAAHLLETRAELLWIAQSYERLADAPGLTRIVDGHRTLELADGASQTTDKIAFP